MRALYEWLFVVLAVGLAATADALATIWANGDKKMSLTFFSLVVISPLVFITFGLITTRIGLAVTSGVVNSLLVLTSISIGLLAFGDWHRVTSFQLLGMGLSVIGIFLMLFFQKQT